MLNFQIDQVPIDVMIAIQQTSENLYNSNTPGMMQQMDNTSGNNAQVEEQ